MNPVMVYMTAANIGQAQAISEALIASRLAACVNLLEGMTSMYWWEGQIEQAQEIVILAKTREELMPALVERVREIHEYECPCIVSWPLTDGYLPFLEWIRQETDSGNG